MYLLNPFMLEGGGEPNRCGFKPLIKRSKGNPYLKIRDFYQLFVANAPMKKKKFDYQSTFVFAP